MVLPMGGGLRSVFGGGGPGMPPLKRLLLSDVGGPGMPPFRFSDGLLELYVFPLMALSWRNGLVPGGL